jgi:subfamily B ATP-binding cassette protein MsbA
MTLGRLAALHAMAGLLIGPLERMACTYPAIQKAAAAAERLAEVLGLNGEREGVIERRIAGSLEFRNVSFRYGTQPAVIDNRSFHIAAGECVGVIGDSGRGKTTLAHLIAGSFQPTGGSILIDGIDLRDYSLDCLRREIALIPQQITLFNASLAENIRLAHPAATAREFRAAATGARIDELAHRLPAGYETTIGENGIRLSAGERLRIAVARAILRNPAILIVDEPASPLDTPSQAVVQRIVNERRGLRTTIVISPQWITFDRALDLNCAA